MCGITLRPNPRPSTVIPEHQVRSGKRKGMWYLTLPGLGRLSGQVRMSSVGRTALP